MVDISQYAAQINQAMQGVDFGCDDPRQAALEELLNAGYKADKIIADKIIRIPDPYDKPRENTGWYIYQEFDDYANDGKVVGILTYGSWRLDEKFTFRTKNKECMSTSEVSAYNLLMEKAKIAREQEQERIYSEASEKALKIYENANINGSNDYLIRKQVTAVNGIKFLSESQEITLRDVSFVAGDIVIPVCGNGTLNSLEFINSNGEKRFLVGGKKVGGFFPLKGLDDFVFIAEGYSTACSIHLATKRTVYVAFDAGNIYNVASMVKNKHQNSQIYICGDDDQFKERGNTGRKKAEQVAEGLGINVVFPFFKNLESKPTDFNDLAVLEGLDEVKSQLLPFENGELKAYQKKQSVADKIDDLAPPQGFLRDVYNYYNTTSLNNQKGFAIQTALALGSILCARRFITSAQNTTSLYFLNIGKSATGKEHAKTVIERVLDETGMGKLICGDGYTSAGGVFSTLLYFSPRHITVIDEFGRFLEAANQSGSSNQKEANSMLMQAYTRTHGVCRPPNYSQMTMKKDQAKDSTPRFIENPAITMLGMTVPVNFFKNINLEALKDGFINRFLISISDEKRTVWKLKDYIEVPQSLKDWVFNLNKRCGDMQDIPTERVNFIKISFSDEAYDLQTKFQERLLVLGDSLEKYSMEEMSGRANETALRVSLIVALARDPMTETITGEDMDWSIKYVESCLMKTINCLKMGISGSEHEANKKEILQALRDVSPEWVRYSSMRKTPPYSKYTEKELKEILTALIEAELVDSRPAHGTRTIEYRAVE